MKRRERVLFIGTQFSNLYTAVDTPARGRVVVCLVLLCLVFVCKYVLGHSRVSQPLNLRLCLLRHLGFLTSPHASPTCRRRRLNSYRLLRRSTPGPTLFEGAKGERFRQVQLSPGVRRTKGKLLRLFVYEDDLATGGYQSVQSMNVLNSGL